MTRWQREVLGVIAAGEVTMVYPVASKAFAGGSAWRYRSTPARPGLALPDRALTNLVTRQ